MKSSLQGRSVALLTRHGKGPLVAPALAALGLSLRVTDAFDTDTLGTFSGEVERTLSPLACARRKARLACELTGLDLGLGSEGSFGGGPVPGAVNWDEELLLLWDRSSGQEIVARAAGPVQVAAVAWQSAARLESELAGLDTSQAWIIRRPGGVSKGLAGVSGVLQALAESPPWASSGPDVAGVVIEPDLRAMHCPERRAYIRQAAEQLAQRLQALCPRCAAVDFWPDAQEPGLPCGACEAPTPLPRAAVRRCRPCGHEHREPDPRTAADPQYCQWCNP
ncbi:DUF6671 family protein [Haliea sp.]